MRVLHGTFANARDQGPRHTGYATLWNAFKRIAASAPADEKQALFNGTARRVYRLD